MGPTTVITRHIFGIRHLSSQLKVDPKTKSSVIIICLLSLSRSLDVFLFDLGYLSFQLFFCQELVVSPRFSP